MSGNMMSLTLSCFAHGRDVAVGLVFPAAGYAAVWWAAEQRLERRNPSSATWARLEFETAACIVPRRLSPSSAVVAALFDADRRTCTTTEYLTRVPYPGRDLKVAPERLDAFLKARAIDLSWDGSMDTQHPETTASIAL